MSNNNKNQNWNEKEVYQYQKSKSRKNNEHNLCDECFLMYLDNGIKYDKNTWCMHIYKIVKNRK